LKTAIKAIAINFVCAHSPANTIRGLKDLDIYAVLLEGTRAS